FAFSVSSTRIERVNEPPGSRAGICCLPGLTRTPVAAFTLRVPFAVAVPPVLEILTFTVFDLPTFSFSAFGLPSERTGGVDTETAAGAGVEGPEVRPDAGPFGVAGGVGGAGGAGGAEIGKSM